MASGLGGKGGVMGGPMWCDGCRATGAFHCAHPDQCGNMLSATAAADQWKAWIDDLPLPFTFDPALGRLQDFITALTTRIDVPQPAQPTENDLAASEAARIAAEAKVEQLRDRAQKAEAQLTHMTAAWSKDAMEVEELRAKLAKASVAWQLFKDAHTVPEHWSSVDALNAVLQETAP